jgi:hypothetical protein
MRNLLGVFVTEVVEAATGNPVTNEVGAEGNTEWLARFRVALFSKVFIALLRRQRGAIKIMGESYGFELSRLQRSVLDMISGFPGYSTQGNQ